MFGMDDDGVIAHHKEIKVTDMFLRQNPEFYLVDPSSKKAPHCCNMNPFLACSICGVLFAERQRRPIRIMFTKSNQRKEQRFSTVPSNDRYPQMKVPVARIDTITAGHLWTRDVIVE